MVAVAKPAPPHAVAVLSVDGAGRQIVSVHIKHAYHLSASGGCRPADAPEPLLFPSDPTHLDPGVPESDVIPFKASTDLIVMAEAHASSRRTQMDVVVQVEKTRRVYRVFGERRCIYRGRGSYAFSQPKPFDRVPLCYARAYGGIDADWPLAEQIRVEDALLLPDNAYPRNLVGLGYVIAESKQLDGLLLPQLENPEDLLTPQRLVVGAPERWWRQPFPWSCDWFDGEWYPRSSFYGGLPRGTPELDADMFEVRAGWVQPGQLQRFDTLASDQRIDNRCADAASPALTLPFMRGDERVLLEGVMPGGGALTVQLPGAAPQVTLRFQGKEHVLEVRLHRVLISTLQMGVYLVWHAAFYPERPLPLRHPTRSERSTPDLEGVEVSADGQRVPHFEEWEAEAS